MKTVRNTSLSRLLQYSLREYWMVMKAFVVVMGLKVLLRLFPFEKVVSMTNVNPDRRDSLLGEALETYKRQVVRAVRAVARRFLGDKPCLPQALAVKYFLANVGKESRLEIGVIKKSAHKLDAHAWLKVDDDIIIGGRRVSSTFVPLQPFRQEEAELMQ